MTSATRTAHGSRVRADAQGAGVLRGTSRGARRCKRLRSGAPTPVGRVTAPHRDHPHAQRCRNLHPPVTRSRRTSCTIRSACRIAHRSAVSPRPAAGTGTGPIIGVPTPRVSPSPAAPPASPPPGVPAPWWRSAARPRRHRRDRRLGRCHRRRRRGRRHHRHARPGPAGRPGVPGPRLLAADEHPRPDRQGRSWPSSGRSAGRS